MRARCSAAPFPAGIRRYSAQACRPESSAPPTSRDTAAIKCSSAARCTFRSRRRRCGIACLSSSSFWKRKLSPIRAVLGHFLFVYIHPYTDGNGRLARFLMNLMLVPAGYVWTVIPVEKRKRSNLFLGRVEDRMKRSIGLPRGRLQAASNNCVAVHPDDPHGFAILARLARHAYTGRMSHGDRHAPQHT